MITLVPCLIGCILLWKVPKTNIGAALAGIYMNVGLVCAHFCRPQLKRLFLHQSTFAGALSQIQAFIPSNTAGTSKKTFSAASAFLAYALGELRPSGHCASANTVNSGNITGPLLLKGHEAPTYPTGFRSYTACIAACIATLGIYRILCDLENKRRDGLGAASHADHAFENQTDKQNLSFRYAL